MGIRREFDKAGAAVQTTAPSSGSQGAGGGEVEHQEGMDMPGTEEVGGGCTTLRSETYTSLADSHFGA